MKALLHPTPPKNPTENGAMPHGALGTLNVPKEVVDERLQRGPVHRGEGLQEPPVLPDLRLLILQRCEGEKFKHEGA